jgi:hypothetical protein
MVKNVNFEYDPLYESNHIVMRPMKFSCFFSELISRLFLWLCYFVVMSRAVGRAVFTIHSYVKEEKVDY